MKRWVKMVALLGVAAVLTGAYVIAGNITKNSEVTEEEGSFALTDRALTEVEKLSWNINEGTYSFSRSEELWVMDENSAFPVNSDLIEELAETLVTLQAKRKLENMENPSDYGLSEPGFSATITWSDGSQTSYSLGDATAFEDGYYLSTGEEGIAYIISDSIRDSFDLTELQLALQEEIPQVENVTSITIGSELHAEYREASTVIDPEAHWYDSLSGDALSTSSIEELIAEARDMYWDTLVAVGATEDELLDYGLDAGHITNIGTSNDEGESMEVWIGSMDENGNYYARLPDSDMVYTITAEDLEMLMGIKESELKLTQLLNVAAEQLSEVSLSCEGKDYTFTCEVIEAETDTEDSESETSTLSVTLNGEAADETAFKELWSQLSALSYGSIIEDAPTGEAILTISAENLNGVRQELSVYGYDADNYLVTDSAGCTMTVSADALDRVRRMLGSF